MRHLLPASLLALSSILSAQDITHATLLIGGSKAISEGNATSRARLEFTYQQSTATLTLVVHNTTPVVEVPNPVIAEIYFMAPPTAVTGMDLVSQAGSGGQTPIWIFDFDPDVHAKPSKNNAGPYGYFSGWIRTPSGDAVNGISNPAASSENIAGPKDSWVIGPVTFVFHVSGATSGLNASAFAYSLPGHVTGNKPAMPSIFKFHSNGASWVGTELNCFPSSFSIGDPCIGKTFNLALGGSPGCMYCLFFTFNPTPTVIAGFDIPAGPPYLHVLSADFTNPPGFLPVTIPNDPSLVGLIVYYFLAAAGPAATQVDFSPRYQFQICQ